MGQQQLLLVILVTIIVGIATVVAINVFGESAANANQDAVRNDVLNIAASAQGWYIKPKMMDGGGNTFNDMLFTDINFPAETISTDGLTAYNMNGTYVLSGGAAGEITVTAHPSSCTNYADDQLCDATEQMIAKILPSNLAWQS